MANGDLICLEGKTIVVITKDAVWSTEILFLLQKSSYSIARKFTDTFIKEHREAFCSCHAQPAWCSPPRQEAGRARTVPRGEALCKSAALGYLSWMDIDHSQYNVFQ